MREHISGRLAANFRSGNIAESLAIQMLRPVAAVAPVPREEDFGIDLIATLLRRSGKALSAEDTFAVQIKISTAANFRFKGEGLAWLRKLDIPYFPLVMDLKKATAALFSINDHRRAFMLHSRVKEINFTLEGDGLNDFPLADPLMEWTLDDATSGDFPEWAYSVLKPAIQVEAWNHHYFPTQSIRPLIYKTARFSDRGVDGLAKIIPKGGEIVHTPPGSGKFIRDSLTNILDPFVGWASNTGKHDHLGAELLTIRSSFRRFGLDPDPCNTWDEIASDMAEHAANKVT